MNFLCRKPHEKHFSFCRKVESWWMRRKIFILCGLGGEGWFFGFIKYEKDEKLFEEEKDQI